VARHTGEVTSVHVSPNGQRVLTASDDKTARLWESQSGKLLLEFRHQDGVESAVWNAQGILLQRASRWDHALASFSKAIDLTDHGTDFPTVRAKALRCRSEVLKQLGRADEAQANVLKASNSAARRASAAQPR